MTDDEILARWQRGGDAPVDVKAEQAATSAPIGISSRQIFTIALMAIAGWLLAGGYILLNGADASDRAAILQSSINIATTAFGFYLGSSASSRNKEHRP